MIVRRPKAAEDIEREVVIEVIRVLGAGQNMDVEIGGHRGPVT